MTMQQIRTHEYGKRWTRDGRRERELPKIEEERVSPTTYLRYVRLQLLNVDTVGDQGEN